MQVSAEIRWFWWREEPASLIEWFTTKKHHPLAAAGGKKPREDRYLREPAQAELGIKRRGSVTAGAEVKGLVDVLKDGLRAAPFSGPIEIWTKWRSDALALSDEATIAVKKWRWLRKFATVPRLEEIELQDDEQPRCGASPERGCNVELTRLQPPSGETGWTFGFEAFGTLATVADDLRRVAQFLAERDPPTLSTGVLASYPAWLRGYLKK